MRYASIRGMEVSRVGIGVAGFGSPHQPPKEAMGILEEFIGLGGNLIDTANVYGNWAGKEGRGSSEKALGAIFRDRPSIRDALLVCTKGAHFELGDKSRTPRVNEGCIKYDIDDSLKNLGVDSIDLYLLHRDNPTYPVWLIMDALFEAQDAGKVRHIGASNWSAARMAEAGGYARSVGREGFAANQIMFSYAHPLAVDSHASRYFMEDEEGGVYVSEGIALLTYTSHARGYMAKVLGGSPISEHMRRLFDCEANRGRAARAAEVAGEVGGGCTAERVGLAYLHALPYNVVTVVGFSSLGQMRESCDCGLELTPEQVMYLRGDDVPPVREPIPW